MPDNSLANCINYIWEKPLKLNEYLLGNYRKRFGPSWINYLWGEQKEFISLLLSLDVLVYIV
jgi:hypothetical protein